MGWVLPLDEIARLALGALNAVAQEEIVHQLLVFMISQDLLDERGWTFPVNTKINLLLGPR